MQDSGLNQMLLTTMVTNNNINYAITAFSSDGAIDKQRAITIGAIKGTLFGFLIILVVSWLLLFWRQRKHEEDEMEADYDYAYGSLISDDDESQDTFIVSPTRYSLRLALKKDHQGTKLEMDSIGGYWEEDSPCSSSSPRKSSLRLALKKHQGLGLEWEDSGERHSCRLSHQHSES